VGVVAVVTIRIPGRLARHHALNNLIARAFASIPIMKEAQGMAWSYGKQPDGLTLIPWQARKALL